MKVRVGTRGSRLALIQTQGVVDAMREHNPDLIFETVIIKTKGDQIQDIALEKIGDKGLFVTEIEKALLEGQIDMAVHSLKDMPGLVTEGLQFAPELKREDPRDILLMRQEIKSLADIPSGAVIGTGSKRRKYQLLALRPDLMVKDIRGNVDTRIAKMNSGEFDGIILALAGLKRLGIKPVNSHVFSEDEMLPAPAQGILAIQLRNGDTELLKALAPLKCEDSQRQALAERAFLKDIKGSCHMPIGAKASIEAGRLTLKGLLGDERGEKLVQLEISGAAEDAESLGQLLAKQTLEAMGDGR